MVKKEVNMSKKHNTFKKADELVHEDDIFEEMLMESFEGDIMLDMLSHIADTDRDQSQISLELTKLILDKTTDGKITENDILSIFKKSKQFVSSCSPLQNILKKIG